jgi:hypothetical protein
MIYLEILGLFILLTFLTFPLWIHGNYKTIFDFKENHKINKYLKLEQRSYNLQKQFNKICSQKQPFLIDEKTSIICNFPCTGKCVFK